jgi:hypothetical protein
MNWVISRMKWVMLVSGILTCTMILAAIAPRVALELTFGDAISGPIAEIVVRNWGALIAIIGAMLIYAAYNPASRPLVLVVAVVSKLIFISLNLVYGPQFLEKSALAIIVDSVMIALFLIYLFGARKHNDGA